MKRFISTAIVLMIVLSMFSGIQISAAADDTYAYKLTETELKLSAVEETKSDDGAYVSLKTIGGDSWFAINKLNVPSDYKVLAIKYAAPANTDFSGNNHYIATVSGLEYGQPGSFCSPNMTADYKWHLTTYDITTSFTGVQNNNIKSVRIKAGTAVGAEARFAYVGFFKTVEDAKAYDAEYCANNTLEDLQRAEMIPQAYEKAPEFTFDMNNMAPGTDIFADKGLNEQFVPVSGTGNRASISIEQGNFLKMSDFTSLAYKYRWLGASEISIDLKPGSASHYSGFFVRSGNEGANPFYEHDGGMMTTNGMQAVGTTGVAFTFKNMGNTYAVEIYIKSIDNNGQLSVKGVLFENIVENISDFNTYKIKDDDKGTILFYANDVLFAKVKYSDPKMTVSDKYSEKYYHTAKILNANDQVLAEIQNSLISTQSTLKFGARADVLYIDNIIIKELDDAPVVPAVPVISETGATQLDSEKATLIDAAGDNNLAVEPANKNFGYIANGDAVEWDVKFTKAGVYKVLIPVSSQAGAGRLSVYLNNEKQWSAGSFPNVGDWQTYTHSAETYINVKAAGDAKLKIVFDEAGMNVKAPSVEYNGDTMPEAPVIWTQTPIADGSDGKTNPGESIVFETTTYLGVRLNLATKTKGFNFLQWTPGGGKGHFKYKVEVFKWNKDLDTTKAGEALFAKEITTPSDGVQDIQFGKVLPAGQYLILFTGLDRSIDEGSTEAIESVRMHFQTGGKLFAENNEKYFEVFTDAIASGEGIKRVPLIQINVPEGTTNAFAELTNNDDPQIPDDPNVPDTGDNSWAFSVLVLALAAAFVVLYYKKRIIE